MSNEERITALEARLAAAEWRLAAAETRWPVVGPTYGLPGAWNDGAGAIWQVPCVVCGVCNCGQQHFKVTNTVAVTPVGGVL